MANRTLLIKTANAQTTNKERAMDTTGLVRCYRCGALYKDGLWDLVNYEGTSSTPRPIMKIPDGCPICCEPPQTEPSPSMAAPM